LGFFEIKASVRPSRNKVKDELLHKQECNFCPLNAVRGNLHPHLQPDGSTKPLIYMLGASPDPDEDRAGRHFVGKAGRTLRRRISEEWDDRMRWNMCARTATPKGRAPTHTELECCRPSVARDIVTTKPKAIFGFGPTPLHWAMKQTGITKWVMRKIPIRVRVPLTDEYHDCWYFPMFHPEYVNRMRGEYGQDVGFLFEMNLQWAFDQVGGIGLPIPVVHDAEQAHSGIELVTGHQPGDLRKVQKFLLRAEKASLTGFDLETNGLRPYNKTAKILTAAVSTSDDTLAFAVAHKGAGWSPQEARTLAEALSGYIHRAKGRIAVHNAAFELEWGAFFFGKEICRAVQWEDTIAQAYVLDERKGCLSLEFLVQQYFGINIKKLAGLDRKNLDDAPLQDVLLYNGVDAKYHRALYKEQKARLKDEKLLDVYKHHLERVPTMVLTQLQGLPVNQKQVQALYDKYKSKSNAAEKIILNHKVVKRFEKSTKREFRISAPADVKKALAAFGCHPDAMDKVTLKQFHGGDLDDFLKALITWREANKVLSTYILPCMPGSPNVFDDGRLHPVIATTTTTTARTSSYEPNIQNWPKRNEGQKEVRKQIKPRKGPRGKRVVVSFDYGQIQARNVAMESKDETLIKAFWTNYDIHADWRDRIAAKCPDWMHGYKGLTSEQEKKDFLKGKRHGAKNGFVFPAFFGAREKKLASLLQIDPMDCRELLDEFLAEFSGIHSWHQRIEKFYAKYGYVTGCSGYRRRAPITRNELINAPIQADEAMIVCDAMARLSKLAYPATQADRIIRARPSLQAGMEIHDDLTFIWYEADVEKNVETVVDTMLNCPFEWAHIVPISVEWALGDDWYLLKDQGAFASNTWKAAA